MAGHRKLRGDPITLVARHDTRRLRLARETAAADTPRRRAEIAFDYLRAALSATDRNHRRSADDAADRAATTLTTLADELYAAAIKDRRTNR